MKKPSSIQFNEQCRYNRDSGVYICENYPVMSTLERLEIFRTCLLATLSELSDIAFPCNARQNWSQKIEPEGSVDHRTGKSPQNSKLTFTPADDRANIEILTNKFHGIRLYGSPRNKSRFGYSIVHLSNPKPVDRADIRGIGEASARAKGLSEEYPEVMKAQGKLSSTGNPIEDGRAVYNLLCRIFKTPGLVTFDESTGDTFVSSTKDNNGILIRGVEEMRLVGFIFRPIATETLDGDVDDPSKFNHGEVLFVYRPDQLHE